MPINVTCLCGFQGKARDSLAGQTTKCPSCGMPLTVRRPEELFVPSTPPVAKVEPLSSQPASVLLPTARPSWSLRSLQRAQSFPPVLRCFFVLASLGFLPLLCALLWVTSGAGEKARASAVEEMTIGEALRWNTPEAILEAVDQRVAPGDKHDDYHRLIFQASRDFGLSESQIVDYLVRTVTRLNKAGHYTLPWLLLRHACAYTADLPVRPKFSGFLQMYELWRGQGMEHYEAILKAAK